jgi:transposase
MANRLKMAEHQAILGLARLRWSYRRIAAELGVDRQTVSRHVRSAAEGEALSALGDPPGIGPADSNAAISIAGSTAFATGGSAVAEPAISLLPAGAMAGCEDSKATISITGSPASEAGSNAAISIAGSAGSTPSTGSVQASSPQVGRRSRCEPWRAVIIASLEQGLTAQRIWQDLKSEHGFVDGYQTVQRFVRHLKAATPLPFRRMECEPGEEAQIDFGKGAPVVSADGKRRRPHLFRIVLSCSRKAYSEVVPRQTTEAFLRCIENAFCHFGGVPKTLVIDNLKAAVTKADWYDPELNPKITAFCQHYGTVVLPTRVRTPRHKGKIERGVGYAQSNALKGRTFDSLAEQNRFLHEWESGIADTRIHGTTRKQVGKLFEEVEKPALLPLPPARFPSFAEARRIVNRDGHVEVAKAYYSAPPEFVGRSVWARWDGRVVRLFDDQLRQIALHAQHEPGRFTTDAKHIVPQKRGGIERGTVWWMQKVNAIGANAGRWAESILNQRGVHGIRVIMGLVRLTQRHPVHAVEQACSVAQSHGADRLRDLRNLLKWSAPPPVQEQFEFVEHHPLIRSLADYGQLVHAAFEQTSITNSSKECCHE